MDTAVENGLDRLIWIDCETFGLDPHVDPVIEVGIRITDLELVTIDEIDLMIWDTPEYDGVFQHLMDKGIVQGDKGANHVIEMHNKSGLWESARKSGLPIEDATYALHSWLDSHGVDGEPYCGSSVSFDKSMIEVQFPDVAAAFGYRVIDISSLKELCKRYNPRVYSRLGDAVTPAKLHRVVPDLTDTINEFRFYRDEFLLVP